MKQLWRLVLCASALAFAGEANAQDLSFLPASLAHAIEAADANFGKRHVIVFIDLSSVQGAARLIGVPPPSATELTTLLNESGRRQFITVDSVADAIRRGRPTTPEYRAAIAHLPRNTVLDERDTVLWIRDGGIVIRVNSIARKGAGYRVYLSSTVTYPAFTGLHGFHTAVDIALMDGMWMVTGR